MKASIAGRLIIKQLVKMLEHPAGSVAQEAGQKEPVEDASIRPPEAEIEFMWRSFTNINEWVRFSDTKAAAVLAANGVIVGSIATWLAGSHIGVTGSWPVILWLGFIVIASFYSAAYSLWSLLPTLFVSKHIASTNKGKISLIFFADIARHFPTPEDYLLTVHKTLSDPQGAIAEISQQVWANSSVAEYKYVRVTNAIRGLAYAVCLGFFGIVILAALRLARSI